MRSNIDRTRTELANRTETDRVEIDGDMDGVILRALVDDVTDDFEEFVEDDLGLEIVNRKYIGLGFGAEVEVK